MADLQRNGRNVAKVVLLEDVEPRTTAEAVDTGDWKAVIAERNSAAPDVRFLETPVVVDNSINQVETALNRAWEMAVAGAWESGR